MMNDVETKLPLAVCRHAVMKLDSFVNDMSDIISDESVDKEDVELCTMLSEYAMMMGASIISMVSKEIDEDIFLAEAIPSDDEIDMKLFATPNEQ